MKAVIAIDSFKGSLSSLEAGTAIREGIRRADPTAQVILRPLADGGEGTVEALTRGLDGNLRTVPVTGPLGEQLPASYGILPDGTAVIEMSAAAGITLVLPQHLDPLHTTTFGVGQLIRDAIQNGCRHFIVGIGGSATNDGGAGMLQALGYGLLNDQGAPIPFGAEGLKDLARFSFDQVIPELADCSFRIACDVTNPLCGPSGCSAVFGPQKGADPDMVRQMDGYLSRYAHLVRSVRPQADPAYPGAGAAGGLGFAFLAFTRSSLESGARIVLEETKLAEFVGQSDLLVTGEGRLDEQTVMGKAPVEAAKIAKKLGKGVIAFSGSVTPGARACNEAGIDAFFPILRTVCTLEEAMSPEQARQNLTDTAEQVFRLLHLQTLLCSPERQDRV